MTTAIRPALPAVLAASFFACSDDKSATDPFAYCASVGTIDARDARDTGPKAPDALLAGMRTVLGFASVVPADAIARLCHISTLAREAFGAALRAALRKG